VRAQRSIGFVSRAGGLTMASCQRALPWHKANGGGYAQMRLLGVSPAVRSCESCELSVSIRGVVVECHFPCSGSALQRWLATNP
jgi:hypothetical protein